MEAKRLLERIREISRNPHWRGTVDPDTLQESILGHLQSILNTRQGSAIIGQDFGVPDFSMLAGSFDFAEISSIEKGIQEVVARYEPRLHNVKVRFHSDPNEPLQMYFVMEADMIGTAGEQAVIFETVLSSSGRFTIKRPG